MLHKEFRIVCTDHDQHPSRELLLLAPTPPYNDKGSWVGDQADLGKTWAEWEPTAERNAHGKVVYSESTTAQTSRGKLWTFECPTCRRNEQIQDDDLGRIVLAFVEAGKRVFDISARRH